MNADMFLQRLQDATTPPLIVAELSGNHNASLETALALVEAAAAAGCDAVKLQTFTADSMTLRSDAPAFRVHTGQGLWDGRTLWDLYRQAATPWSWHPEVFARARSLGMACFSTPFDDDAVDQLETLDPPCHKIASFELTDIALIRRAARTGRPLVVSTGMASPEEIDRAVKAAREAGATTLVLLRCTSTYPSTAETANLRGMLTLAVGWNALPGLSDHTPGIGVAVAAAALGARLIEKHFVLRRAEGGVDAAFSMEPDEMAQLVVECRRAHAALGTGVIAPDPSELVSRHYRRAIYAVQPIPAGSRIEAHHIRRLRPVLGIPAELWDDVLGATAAEDIPAGTPLQLHMLCR
jgi:N-acetylneuraminate synthase